ncbi:MAG: exopolysaccharide biosynthesis polyprenyl glycosylphosphotransferase [Mesorhizobium sp.]
MSSRHPLQRKRYQILGGLLFAIGLPLAIRLALDPRLILSNNLQITVTAAAFAHVSGYFVYRRLGAFPGVAATGAILPTFALTYGAVFLLIFFFRFDYSRFQAAGSFLMSVSWYFGVGLFMRRRAPYRLAIVPGGQVEQVRSIAGVTWRPLGAPDAPLPARIHGVVVDLRSDLSDAWERFIADCALAGTPVYHVKQIMESLTGRVAIEHLSENTLGSINPNMAYFAVKGAIDRLGAAIVLLALSPLLLGVALAIRIESLGPALFRQERVGYRGETFTVFKFRTMRADTAGSKDISERERAITQDGDPRITRLGRFLRRTRIDELPQLLNVLRGEMSWIGPRPEAAVLSQWYQGELPFYRYRHIVRPGITGWAQVNQGHVAQVDEVLDKLHYDFYYIKNFSPWLDIVITLRTIKIVLTGFGAR